MAVRAASEVLQDSPDRDGKFNYLISSIIDEVYLHNYESFNAAMGVLECVKQEFYRRVVGPYEDRKIVTNGEVFWSIPN